MSGKSILIIDPDDTVSSILKKSILGYDPTSIVTSFNEVEKSRLSPGADIFICDISELVKAIHSLPNPIPSAIYDHAILVITTYGDNLEDLPAEATSRAVFIQKPIDQRGFSALIADQIGPIDTEIVQQSSLSKEQYRFCHKKLLELRTVTSARCVLLSDSVGSILDTVGDSAGLTFDLITSLLGGGLGTLQEAGRVIDKTGGINLAYREGIKSDLYAVNIGRTLFIAILVDRIANHARLGTVWYYARQSVKEIEDFLKTSKISQNNEPFFRQENSQELSEELDKLSF